MIKATPATPILAEPNTVTGSIGVYASFPNGEELAKKVGVEVKTIKAGNLKASGSMFRKMRPDEEVMFQHWIDRSYLHFLDIVEEARGPRLTRKTLQDDITITETLPVRQGSNREKQYDFKRYLADGGIYTAREAKEHKLIDKIGYLSDALKEAARLADLQNYKAISYDRPSSLLGSLLGVKADKPLGQLDAANLAAASSPRLWYLAPGHEMAGLLTALGR
jgi:protease-4